VTSPAVVPRAAAEDLLAWALTGYVLRRGVTARASSALDAPEWIADYLADKGYGLVRLDQHEH
jgi:hypothetical protein